MALRSHMGIGNHKTLVTTILRLLTTFNLCIESCYFQGSFNNFVSLESHWIVVKQAHKKLFPKFHRQGY